MHLASRCCRGLLTIRLDVSVGCKEEHDIQVEEEGPASRSAWLDNKEEHIFRPCNLNGNGSNLTLLEPHCKGGCGEGRSP